MIFHISLILPSIFTNTFRTILKFIYYSFPRHTNFPFHSIYQITYFHGTQFYIFHNLNFTPYFKIIIYYYTILFTSPYRYKKKFPLIPLRIQKKNPNHKHPSNLLTHLQPSKNPSLQVEASHQSKQSNLSLITPDSPADYSPGNQRDHHRFLFIGRAQDAYTHFLLLLSFSNINRRNKLSCPSTP